MQSPGTTSEMSNSRRPHNFRLEGTREDGHHWSPVEGVTWCKTEPGEVTAGFAGDTEEKQPLLEILP